ncbi:hypothetical protein DFH09DRAFT_1079229 [Mycena vulgaris]|nr:hypothetical protein DFH09DRAFT_1079229 [Mycena vulgaris]
MDSSEGALTRNIQDGVIQKSWFTRSADPTRHPKRQGYFFVLQSVAFMEWLDKDGEKCMYSVLQSDMMPARGIGYTCDVTVKWSLGRSFQVLRSHSGPYKKGELIGLFVMSTEFLYWLLVASPPSLARAKYFRDFIPTRDRSLSRSSLFSFKDMADESNMDIMHRSQGLRRYIGWLFGEINFVGVLYVICIPLATFPHLSQDNEKGLCVRLCCPRDATCSAEALFVDQIEVLHETISVEEELKGGMRLES